MYKLQVTSWFVSILRCVSVNLSVIFVLSVLSKVNKSFAVLSINTSTSSDL